MHPDKMDQAQIDSEIFVSKKMLEKGYEFMIFSESNAYMIPAYAKTVEDVCNILRAELKFEKPYVIHIHSFMAKYESYETPESRI